MLQQRKVNALKAAMAAAQASLDTATDVLLLLEDAYPAPAPEPIEKLKKYFGDVAQRWTEARNYADQKLREL